MAVVDNSSDLLKILDAIENDDINGDAIENDDHDGGDETVRAMTQLQVAVVHGRSDLIPALVSGCPNSIVELTSKNQTVFHLAAEFCSPVAFEVLLEETRKLNKEYVLVGEDCEGNTALHIAVSKKQVRIVQMCLPDLSSTTGHDFMFRVNAKNMKGETAMDIYNKIPNPDSETRHIGRILREASRRESRFSSHQLVDRRSRIHPWHALETKNVLLVVLTLFIALAFSVTCALPTFFPKDYIDQVGSVFELKDLVYVQLPLIFYIVSFLTVVLTTSTCILSVLLYSFPCGSLMLLGGFSTFTLYLLLAYFVMPKFTVRVSSRRRHSVPSYYLMLVLALGFIFIGVLIIHMGNCLMMGCCNHLKWVKRKFQFWSPNNSRLPLRNPSFKVQMVGNALASTSTSIS